MQLSYSLVFLWSSHNSPNNRHQPVSTLFCFFFFSSLISPSSHHGYLWCAPYSYCFALPSTTGIPTMSSSLVSALSWFASPILVLLAPAMFRPDIRQAYWRFLRQGRCRAATSSSTLVQVFGFTRSASFFDITSHTN